MEVRTRRMRKEVVVCAHYFVGNNKFLFQFEDGNKRDMNSCLLVYLFYKQEI